VKILDLLVRITWSRYRRASRRRSHASFLYWVSFIIICQIISCCVFKSSSCIERKLVVYLERLY